MMRGKWLLVSVLLLGLMLGAVVGLSLAQSGESGASAAPQALVGTAGAVGTGFTYQGRLSKDGSPLTGTCDFKFSLHDALSGGNKIGNTQAIPGVNVVGGLFTVVLNTGGQFGDTAFNGQARWLKMQVQCIGDAGYTVLNPRQELTPAPHALALPGLWTEQNATSPNVIGGYGGNNVAPGVVGATVGGGGTPGYPHQVTANYATIGGGEYISVTGEAGTVGGGSHNSVTGDYATVGGGGYNAASGHGATIAGGGGRSVWDPSIIYTNTASGNWATVSGGIRNTASDIWASVGGGYNNRAGGHSSTVGGGYGNKANGTTATIGGGDYNIASGTYSTIGGGDNNIASGPQRATIAGGGHNTVGGEYNTVGGGLSNSITDAAYYATIPGGIANRVAGSYGFAAGVMARAEHDGTFVWADCGTSCDEYWNATPFTSTAENQFLVRASGGVKMVKGGSTFSSSAAGLQVENQSTYGEAAWLRTSDAANNVPVLKLVKHPDSQANFVEGRTRSDGAVTQKFHIDKDGTYHAGSDFAEALPAAGDKGDYEPGDVLVISSAQPGAVERCSQPYDGAVIGVYSTRPGFLGADKDGATEMWPGDIPVAVMGIVPVKVSAENGPIRPGDLLTTSATPGHAMRCEGVERCFGRTLGKALEGLETGTGVIKMLVVLQ